MTTVGGSRVVAAAPTLIRYPNATDTAIVFVAHEELWTAPLAGGTARQLTRDPGGVIAPRYSPDGRWIAFTGRRAGGCDVYVMPAQGGEPRRLTFDSPTHAGDNLVVAWTPDSRRIVFLSGRSSPISKLIRAYAVSVEGGLPQMLPLDRAGLMSFGPNDHVIAFNRIYRNSELRKRYLGGQQQDISTYDFTSRRLTRITDWKGSDTSPMWFGRTIYFLSDRGVDFRANIWAFDLGTQRVRQITRFADFDIDTPSLGGHAITFQQGGKLYAIDLPGERLREIKIDVPDDAGRTAPRVVEVGKRARVRDALGGVDYALSLHGEALLVSARGDIFRVPAVGAPTNLTLTPGADEDHPSWSPDGRTVAYETDAGGEQQIALRPAAGGPERQLTHFKSGYYYTPVWAPDGSTLALADANHHLWLVPMNDGAPRLIASDPNAEIRDAAFSPDGRWLAYSTQRANRQRAIHLCELATEKDVVVSSPMESDRDPVFTPDGRLLAFVSQRNELPFVSDRDDESLITTLNSDGIYAATLSRLGTSPLVPRPTASAPPTPSTPVQIDLNGLMSRAVALPTTPSVIMSLEARGDQLFYETKPPQLIDGDLPGQTRALHAFDLNTLVDRVVVNDLNTHSLSADGSKVAFRRDGAWRIAATRPDGGQDVALNLDALRVTIDPRSEWVEMFENAWRLDRDVFFSQVMNGDNWTAVHDAYLRFLPLLGSQDDFLYLLGQMQGELASSHTFIGRGAGFDTRPYAPTPLLGVDYALDSATGRYRFAHIYAGDNTRPEIRGALSQPGLDIRDGDYLLAVNGRELKAPTNPLSLFVGLKGTVTLTIAHSAVGPRRDVQVAPLDDEGPVREADWIAHNRQQVNELSGGRLGYVYLSDFDALGSKDFVRQFYPQAEKEGIIFDVRWNLGGFTSQAVLNVLRRKPAGVFVNREEAVTPLPATTAPAVMTTLINYGSASDGDQFAYFFRAFGLGKLVGTRTWGGVQGINGPWRLMDGSFLFIPKDSLAGLDAKWIIENEGVSPDLQVESAVDQPLTGRDVQLEAAVESTLNQLKLQSPRSLRAPPPLPAYPAKGNVPPAHFGD